mgnify:CR=1 FL=1
MDLLELIDTLEEAIERSASIPLSGKSLVDKDELLDLIEEIRLKMPEDLKQAKWVKEERQRILHEAQKEANTIVKSAEDKLISMINEHEITQQAQEKAEEIIENAKNTAKEIRVGVRQYSNDILADLEDVVDEIKGTLHKSLSDVRESVDSIDDALKIIDENRKELSK